MKITMADNQVAILDFETREVDIITIENIDTIEDMEEHLSTLGYNTSSIQYMC